MIDQANTACLDARDAVAKALRLVKGCKFFKQDVLDALLETEDRLTSAINIQLELRRKEISAERVAA